MSTTSFRSDPQSYNYAHFHAGHVMGELTRSLRAPFVGPGDAAPDFRLPRADGGELHLADLRGAVVLVRFASST
jgi:hypothetical protein